MCSSDIFLGLLAILFPPLAVWVKTGICSADSLINILLCMLGYIPGLLHAWYIIAKFPDTIEYERIPHQEGDGRSGRVTYVYVQGGAPGGAPGQAREQRQPKSNSHAMNTGVQNYGTTAAPVAPTVQQSQNGAWSGEAAGEGSSSAAAAPPSYQQAVGDHKVQTKD